MSIDWGPIIAGAVQTGGQIYANKVAARNQRKAELRESIMLQKMYDGNQTYDSALSRTSPTLVKQLGQSVAVAGVSSASSCGAAGAISCTDFVAAVLALSALVFGARFFFEKFYGRR